MIYLQRYLRAKDGTHTQIVIKGHLLYLNLYHSPIEIKTLVALLIESQQYLVAMDFERMQIILATATNWNAPSDFDTVWENEIHSLSGAFAQHETVPEEQ